MCFHNLRPDQGTDMTDYTSQIAALYQAIQFRAPPANLLATYNSDLNSGSTLAQVASLIENEFIHGELRRSGDSRISGRLWPCSRSRGARLLGQSSRDQPRRPRPAQCHFRQLGGIQPYFLGQRQYAVEPGARHRALHQHSRPRAGRRRSRLLGGPAPERRASAAGVRPVRGIPDGYGGSDRELPQSRSRRFAAAADRFAV